MKIVISEITMPSCFKYTCKVLYKLTDQVKSYGFISMETVGC